MALTPASSRRVLRFYWQHASRHRRYLYGALCAVPLTVLIGQYLPALIVAHVLAQLSHEAGRHVDVWQTYGQSLLIYAGLQLLGGAVAWRVVDYFMWQLEGKVEQDLAERVYNHLLVLSARFHADTFGGSLVSQTNKLLTGYVRLADTTVFQTLPMISGLLAVALIMARRAPLFVVALVLFALLYVCSAFALTGRVRRLSAEHAAAESQQTGYLADSIANIMAIKSFAGGRFEAGAFHKTAAATRHRLMQWGFAHMRQMTFFSGLINLISAVALLLAVVSVAVFHANIGTAFLILNYTTSIVSQLFSFSTNSLRNYTRSVGEAADMVGILDSKLEVKDPARPEKVRIKKGTIRFNNVTFTHDGSPPEDALFHKLNLEIPAGQKLGLIGHSGSGKTTLTRILLRFSDVNDGSITIDGQDISQLKQDDLRHHIAYVPQEPLLFHRSLRDNIRYGQESAGEAAIKRVAKLAHADDFIKQLPDKYETLVGERGVKLSGGQRQRVAIARALLKDAPILVLDEATSALDSESEAYIQEALWKLMEGRTAIVVAHRLSTIQKMDRIVVMDDGSIVEEGTHAELLAQNGTYAKLWARQSGGFMEE